MDEEYPTTGRIGRFVKIVQSALGPARSSKVLRKAMEYDSYSPEGKSLWWRNAVDAIDELIGRDAAIGVMRQCGAKCCGDGRRRTARKLYVDLAQSIIMGAASCKFIVTIPDGRHA